MEKSSFFNSIRGDRKYKAEDWANYFNKFITNGYFPNVANNLQVTANALGMNVTLKAGVAWINGYMYNNTSDLTLTIEKADSILSRLDRVVLRCDFAKREIRAYVKKGTAASSPAAPSLQRDADAYELAVAEVRVEYMKDIIAQKDVTDVRLNKDLCGVVNSLLQADTTMIFNQYWDWFVRTKQKYDEDNSTIMSDFRKFMEDEKKRYNTEFTAWFQNLKAVLDSNTAGNLLNEINKINDKWNATLIELDKKSQTIQHGLNVVNAPVASPLNIEIQGRTLVNLAGAISSAWKGTNVESVIDDTTVYKYKKSYKVKTNSNGAAGNVYVAFDVPATMYAGKNYVVRVDVRCESATEMIATPRWDGNIFTTHNQQYSGSSEFVPMFIKVNGKDLSKFTMLIETYKPNFTYWVDTSIAVYDVPGDVFAKINVDPEYSGQKLADKFPYVQGVQHLNPVVVADGGNLIPPFTDSSWYIHVNAKVINPYELELNSKESYNSSFVTIPVVKGIKYTLSVPATSYDIMLYKTAAGGAGTVITFLKAGTSHTFTVDDSYQGFINIRCGNEGAATGKFTFNNLMLVLGDKQKPFVPRNPSYLYTNTSLAGQNGVNDVLYQEDGQWKVLRKWERDVNLDGSYPVRLSSNKSGYKLFSSTIQNNVKDGAFIVKYDNSLLERINHDGGSITKGDQQTSNAGFLFVTALNTDTGFGDVYTPTDDEVKSYFNGWKVKTADGAGKPTAWISVLDGKDAPLQTLAYVKANRAPNYMPYKITYQLAAPREDNVQVEGELAAIGVTQASVDSGVVVREKLTPYYVQNENKGRLNVVSVPSSLSRYKPSNIIAIYKNNIRDLSWTIQTGQDKGYWRDGLRIETQNMDPTAEYTVTYLAQEKHLFTTNVIDAKVMYNQSLSSTVKEVVEKQADNATTITALSNQVTENTSKLNELSESLNVVRTDKDSNSVFTTVEWRTKNNLLRRRSTLSDPDSDMNYRTQTVTKYAKDGVTIASTEVYKRTFDEEGDLISEVVQ